MSWRHGTWYSYVRKGCRCDICRTEMVTRALRYAKPYKPRAEMTEDERRTVRMKARVRAIRRRDNGKA